jgi:hypothetical protein
MQMTMNSLFLCIRTKLYLFGFFFLLYSNGLQAQVKLSPEYVILGTGNMSLNLTVAQKVAIFGSEQQFKEDSTLRVWRTDMLVRLRDISFAERVYSQNPEEYAHYFPADSVGINRRFAAELRQAAPFTDEQVKAITYYKSYLEKKITSEVSSQLRSYTSGICVIELAPISLLGIYLKNKHGKIDWLFRKAKDALWIYYVGMNSSTKLSEKAFDEKKKSILSSFKD